MIVGLDLSYEELDDTLSAWARRHGLHVATKYKDFDVRSVAIADDKGCEYQLWLELHPPNRIRVAAWNYADQSHSQMCDKATLSAALEAAYDVIERWIRADGHTRTPIV